MPDFRRLLRLLHGLLLLLAACMPVAAHDSYARLVQRHLGRFLPGSPGIVVQNMPGAGSLRSVMALVNSPDDVVGTFSSSLLTEAISMPERVKIEYVEHKPTFALN